MERDIQLVKAIQIAAFDRSPLIGHVAVQPLDPLVLEVLGAGADHFDLQRAAHHHPLTDIADPDAGDVGAALRLHHDQTLERQAIDGGGDGEAGDAEPRA
jgi:hypothetical protein